MEHNNLYSTRSLQDLEILSRKHGTRILHHLGKDMRTSASRWGIRHLIAYRLLVRLPAEHLLIRESDHDRECPLCNLHGESSTQTLNPVRVTSLLGVTPRDLGLKSEAELMQLPDGFFWVALARAARPNQAEPPGKHSQRYRKPVERSNYISSTDAIDGSSSPTRPSSSEYEDTSSFVDEDDHSWRRQKPEEVTTHLVTVFLQYALSLCLLQHPDGPASEKEIRPRVERMMHTAQVAGFLKISAEDDGGICTMVRRGQQWQIDNPYMALIEAKRAFSHLQFDERAEDYIPYASNENLAQCLGEAVIAWKGNERPARNEMFVIAATNTFLRLIRFRFGRDYREYLDAADEITQLELIEDEDKDAVVYMDSTEWFNMQSRGGRHRALCNVLALLRWQDGVSEVDHGDSDNQSGGDDMDTDD